MFNVIVDRAIVFTGDWAALCAWLQKQGHPNFRVECA